MSIHMKDLRNLLATAAIMGPAVAFAWTPYGYGPGGPWTGAPSVSPSAAGSQGVSPPAAATAEQEPSAGQDAPYPPQAPYPPDFGYPGFGGPGIGAPGFEPYGSGLGGEPPGYPPFGPPPGFGDYGGPGFGAPAAPGRISRQATEKEYVLEIPLNGMKSEDIQVSAQGRWISISRGQTAQQTQEETFDQGRGYARSFSYSTGSGARRFTLPRDADPQAMRREDGERSVRIIIPRRRD